MSATHIRNVPRETLRSLKRLAWLHPRSLQGELHAILERAARMAPPDGGTRQLNLVTVRGGSHPSWNRDEIYGGDGR